MEMAISTQSAMGRTASYAGVRLANAAGPADTGPTQYRRCRRMLSLATFFA